MPTGRYHNRIIHQFHGDLPHLSASSYAQLFCGLEKKASHDLEYHGDRLLYMTIFPVVLRCHPECTVSQIEHIVAYMTTNCALALLSVSIGLQESSTMSSGELSWFENFELDPTAKVPKRLADSFESFCGALAVESGEAEACTFVENLFEPLVGPAHYDVCIAAPIIARYESEQARVQE